MLLPRTVRAALLAFALGWPAALSAANRPYAFTESTETLADGQLELENWFGVEQPRGADVGLDIDWWIGPVVGITDAVEAALYAIFVQPAQGPDTGRVIGLGALRLRTSALLADPGAWPVDVKLRLEYEQPIGSGYDGRGSRSLWAEAIVSRDLGALNLTGQVTSIVAFEPSGPSLYFRYGAGASLATLSRVRVGLEDFGEWRPDDKVLENYLGPSLAAGVGRVWLSSTLGFGVGHESSRFYGRLVVGLLF